MTHVVNNKFYCHVNSKIARRFASMKHLISYNWEPRLSRALIGP